MDKYASMITAFALGWLLTWAFMPWIQTWSQ
jgi:hypothetical protein